jgi:hypothetical protein
MTTADFWAAIYPWIVAGLGGFVGAALLLPTKLGEALFSYQLGKSLEGFKAEQSRELERQRRSLAMSVIVASGPMKWNSLRSN